MKLIMSEGSQSYSSLQNNVHTFLHTHIHICMHTNIQLIYKYNLLHRISVLHII